jgi:protein subunit release factor A
MLAALHVFVNGKNCGVSDGVKEWMTGAEIANLAGFPANQAVVRLDVKIDVKDLRIDTFTATRSVAQAGHFAVRVTHLPTGFVVSNADMSSQAANRAKAMRNLRDRLQESGVAQRREISANEQIQIESGDHFLVSAL